MKRYNLKINGETYNAYIVSYHESGAVVEVNGNKFSVEFLNDDISNVPVIERSFKEVPSAPAFDSENESDGKMYSPIPGVIVKVIVNEGDEVKKGDTILILEAMKMESEIPSPVSGKVEKIHVKDKAPVQEGQLLATIVPTVAPDQEAPQKSYKTQTKRQAPVQAQPIPTPQATVSASGNVVAPLPGTILNIKVNVGDRVNVGDVVMILEAMKMESEISSEYAGTVKSIRFQNGASVQEGDVMIELGE